MFKIFKTKTGKDDIKDDIPETTRNQLVPSSKELIAYGREVARKRIKEFYESDEGKKLLAATKIK